VILASGMRGHLHFGRVMSQSLQFWRCDRRPVNGKAEPRVACSGPDRANHGGKVRGALV